MHSWSHSLLIVHSLGSIRLPSHDLLPSCHYNLGDESMGYSLGIVALLEFQVPTAIVSQLHAD